MPELPEVESVRLGLERYLVGARVDGVEVHDERSLRRQDGGAQAFRAALRGRTVLAAVRRGKLLWLVLDDARALTAHLGMSGQILVRADGTGTPEASDAVVPADPAAYLAPAGSRVADLTATRPPALIGADDLPRHLRVRLAMTSPRWGGLLVDLVDQRLFGGMHVCPLLPTADGAPGGQGSLEARLPATATHLARDLLDPNLDVRATVARMRSSRRQVKTVLMDQTVVAGVGNIYADEGLWAARLHGGRRARDLGPRVTARLLAATAQVMRRALEVGGTSFDALYVNADGEAGYFARSLEAYGRAGQPCRRCGTLMRSEVRGGRRHTYCPRCQTRPRS